MRVSGAWCTRLERIKRELTAAQAAQAAGSVELEREAEGELELLLEAAYCLVEWDLTYGSRNARAQHARTWAREVTGKLRRFVEYPRPE